MSLLWADAVGVSRQRPTVHGHGIELGPHLHEPHEGDESSSSVQPSARRWGWRSGDLTVLRSKLDPCVTLGRGQSAVFTCRDGSAVLANERDGGTDGRMDRRTEGRMVTMGSRDAGRTSAWRPREELRLVGRLESEPLPSSWEGVWSFSLHQWLGRGHGHHGGEVTSLR